MRTCLCLLLCLSILHGEKVLLLAVEGLTASLLGRVATPALDALVAKGSLSRLQPEFPSETLPTLAAIATGQHTEVTGVLDREVLGEEGGKLTDSSPEYWTQSPNLTALWNLANSGPNGRAGTIRWPGADAAFGGPSNSLRWSQDQKFDIEEDVSQYHTGKGNRSRRAVSYWQDEDEGSKEESIEDEDEDREDREEREIRELRKETVAGTTSRGPGETQGVREKTTFGGSFNKTTDREWLEWAGQVDTAVGWLAREKEPVSLVLMYLEEPGTQIRGWGPLSQQAEFAVMKVDQLVALLTSQLARAGVREKVNIIITGLHGFTEVSTDKVFDISSLLTSPSSVHGHSPVLNIQPGQGESLDTYARLQASADKDKFDLYTKHLVPERFHYRDNSRVAEIVLVAKEGFVFASDFWAEVKSLNRGGRREGKLDNKYGKAGYDPSLGSMEAVLILQGPGVASQAVSEQLVPLVPAVDLYPLVCHLLSLQTPPSNGSLSNLSHLLHSPPSQTVEVIKKTIHYYTEKSRLPQTVTLLACSTLLLLLSICCCACTLRRRRDALGAAHNYKYSSVKSNRRTEGRVDGSETNDGDKVGLLTSSIMEEDLDLEQPA